MNADMFQFSKFQDMARDWIKFKTMLQIIVMLAFSLVVQCFTDLNVAILLSVGSSFVNRDDRSRVVYIGCSSS